MATVRLAAHFLRPLFETGLRRHGPVRSGLGRGPPDQGDAARQARGTVDPGENLIVGSVRRPFSRCRCRLPAPSTAPWPVGIYQGLVVESGWTIEQYEQWVTNSSLDNSSGGRPHHDRTKRFLTVRYEPTCVSSRASSVSRLAGAHDLLRFYAGWMLDLDVIDVEEIATALADQTDYEHRWLIDPRTGEVVFWTSDTGIEVRTGRVRRAGPDRDRPPPVLVWYQDMVDFADGISDRAAGLRLSGSLQGKGAFRRFKNELYQRHPELISAWHAMRDARARVRAVEWLAEEGLIEEVAAQRFQETTASPPCHDVDQCIRRFDSRSRTRVPSPQAGVRKPRHVRTS